MTQVNADDGLLDTILTCLGIVDREVGNRPEQIATVRLLLQADRKKHELDARLDEQKRTFIGRTEPKPEIWFELDGVGHPSTSQVDRITTLQNESEAL